MTRRTGSSDKIPSGQRFTRFAGNHRFFRVLSDSTLLMEATMTYQDRDPDLDTRPTTRSEIRRTDSGFNAMWGWIAGAVVLVLVMVFLFGGSQKTATTDINSSPAAPSMTTPPASDTTAAPRLSPAPAETTGQR
jgi:hypothetical protein